MAAKKLLTIFGATGNQGGSVIDVFFAHPKLREIYRLRGITRNISSSHAKSLSDRGVEMVAANLNDLESLKVAINGSYGVFGLTNFWDPDVLDKQKEIDQSMNIFAACKSEGVKHFVYSSLPYVSKLTGGELTHVSHFDSKAMAAVQIESEKGELITSYFMPAMYMKSAKDEIHLIDGKPTLQMPFAKSAQFAWPFLSPREDTGKYVMGLFEGGSAANGAHVHGVSAWTTIDELLAAMSAEVGTTVEFKATPIEEFRHTHPEQIAEDLTQTMLLVGGYSYYGPDTKAAQQQSDQWLIEGMKPIGLQAMVEATGPWVFSG